VSTGQAIRLPGWSERGPLRCKWCRVVSGSPLVADSARSYQTAACVVVEGMDCPEATEVTVATSSHVSTLSDLPPSRMSEVLAALVRAGRKLMADVECRDMHVIVHSAPEVSHLHFHVVADSAGDERSLDGDWRYCGLAGDIDVWDGSAHTSP